MTMRILHLFVIVALIVAAAYVYDIKFEATMQAEQLSKLRGEIRRERDAVAALRAEWAKLDFAGAHRGPCAATSADEAGRRAIQVDNLANLPERKKPPEPEPYDPIAALIDNGDAAPRPARSPNGARQ